jgi:hypothetical protein
MKHLVRDVLLTLLAIATLAAAGDQATDAPAPAGGSASTEEASDEPVAEPTPTPKAEPTPSPTPSPDVERQLEEFVPSEEVEADQAVAFPVDI